MAWEGYTISGSDGITPPLGSGHRPDHIHNHAAYYRDMRFIKDNLAEEIPRVDELTTHVGPNCHSIDDLHYSGSPKWGYIFFYGGPGGDCVGTQKPTFTHLRKVSDVGLNQGFNQGLIHNER